MSNKKTTEIGPLTGVRVLDLTTVVMGPFCTQILAELGAEVIKVESHEGDTIRHVEPKKNPGMGYMFLSLNRGKRSLVLDLKSKKGREVVSKLLGSADVVIYNIRPDAMARLGLSYENVKKENPKILYVGCYGYSQKGPYAKKPAYDDLIQGISGMPWLFTQMGANPTYTPVNMADRLTGLHAVYAVTAGLFRREKTGLGESIEVPMFESVAHFILGDHLAGHSYEPRDSASFYRRALARRPYVTSDGYICVLVYNDKQWRSFSQIINQPDLMEDKRFSSQENRQVNIEEVYEFLDKVFKTRTTREWVSDLEAGDIPVARMNSVGDVVDDPHLQETGFFKIETHPTEGAVRGMKSPTNWSIHHVGDLRPAPNHGEHTVEILEEIGFSKSEITELEKESVVKTDLKD